MDDLADLLAKVQLLEQRAAVMEAAVRAMRDARFTDLSDRIAALTARLETLEAEKKSAARSLELREMARQRMRSTREATPEALEEARALARDFAGRHRKR